MAYLSINNYSNLGHIGIHQNAINSIAIKAVEAMPGVSVHDSKRGINKSAKGKETISIPTGVRTSLSKDGKAIIRIDVCLAKANALQDRCIEIQRAVSDAVRFACDTITTEVHIRVVRIMTF